MRIHYADTLLGVASRLISTSGNATSAIPDIRRPPLRGVAGRAAGPGGRPGLLPGEA